MKCPECGKETMFEKDNVLECSECGCKYVKVLNNRQENSEGFDKILDGIEDVTEQVFVQVRKEEAYLKNRIKNDSTAPFDENELIISKYIMDKVDHVIGKKPRYSKTQKNENTETKSGNEAKKVKIEVED